MDLFWSTDDDTNLFFPQDIVEEILDKFREDFMTSQFEISAQKLSQRDETSFKADTQIIYQGEVRNSSSWEEHDNWALKLVIESVEDTEELLSINWSASISPTVHEESIIEATLVDLPNDSIQKSKTSIGLPITISGKLREFYKQMQENQKLIEQGLSIKRGPGRRRRNSYKTSEEIKQVIINYLTQKFKKVIYNKRCEKRKDALVTLFFRAVKKLTYELVETCATINSYKHSQPEEFIVSYAEAHFAFLTSLKKEDEVLNLDNFIEFIIIYFPEDKVRTLLAQFLEEKCISEKYAKRQLTLLDERDITSRKHIKKWTQESSTLQQILKLSLEVLGSSEFKTNSQAKYLYTMTEGILNQWNY